VLDQSTAVQQAVQAYQDESCILEVLTIHGWKPMDVIRKAFEATTQWAATTFSTPMKRHYK